VVVLVLILSANRDAQRGHQENRQNKFRQFHVTTPWFEVFSQRHSLAPSTLSLNSGMGRRINDVPWYA